MSISVIAGLGNPGPKYRNTRHNLGYDLIDRLAIQLRTQWKVVPKFEAEIAHANFRDKKLVLVKPLTFVNACSRSLGPILRHWSLSPESLLVLYDDITLEFSRVKLSQNGSPGGHNGIADLQEHLGDHFARFRIGIGAKPHKEMDLADYVLSHLTKNEKNLLAELSPSYLEQISLIIESGTEAAMNIINQRTAT